MGIEDKGLAEIFRQGGDRLQGPLKIDARFVCTVWPGTIAR